MTTSHTHIECAACAIERPTGRSEVAGSTRGGNEKALVFSRAICTLCWICRYHFWVPGLDYENTPQVREKNTDKSWGEALDRNGYKGGTFKLPVVVHGDKAWWDIKVRDVECVLEGVQCSVLQCVAVC
eukprot:CAMPEP_0173081994 /NCGR_PEP_ID=MMETSP1102-20130122/17805_1 /TAXON_ID=49646 /ORGANISM="Geminigera sp., Strain Caron Lab Isolate" /LENGTH=127 /DNA_ID=CAMNT_0013957083 /DNA_START=363 /DNA_END=743 /DNA_ORIENTATION=-